MIGAIDVVECATASAMHVGCHCRGISTGGATGGAFSAPGACEAPILACDAPHTSRGNQLGSPSLIWMKSLPWTAMLWHLLLQPRPQMSQVWFQHVSLCFPLVLQLHSVLNVEGESGKGRLRMIPVTDKLLEEPVGRVLQSLPVTWDAMVGRVGQCRGWGAERVVLFCGMSIKVPAPGFTAHRTTHLSIELVLLPCRLLVCRLIAGSPSACFISSQSTQPPVCDVHQVQAALFDLIEELRLGRVTPGQVDDESMNMRVGDLLAESVQEYRQALKRMKDGKPPVWERQLGEEVEGAEIPDAEQVGLAKAVCTSTMSARVPFSAIPLHAISISVLARDESPVGTPVAVCPLWPFLLFLPPFMCFQGKMQSVHPFVDSPALRRGRCRYAVAAGHLRCQRVMTCRRTTPPTLGTVRTPTPFLHEREPQGPVPLGVSFSSILRIAGQARMVRSR